MPRVTTKGQVTIPKEVRDALGIQPGDEVTFERSNGEFRLRKGTPGKEDGDDPFDFYRGQADSDETMVDRLRRLRGEYPRSVGDDDRRTGADP